MLAKLEPAREGEPIGLYHGSPRDPIWEYVLSTDQAEDCFDSMDPRVGESATATWRCASRARTAR